MGCDIHLHAEMRINGRWEYAGSVEVGRCYTSFGKIAGVRDNNQTQLTYPNGLPEDVNPMTRFLIMKTTDHSCGFMEGKHLKKYTTWARSDKREEPVIDIVKELKWSFGYEIDEKVIYSKDFRLVYGFDS